MATIPNEFRESQWRISRIEIRADNRRFLPCERAFNPQPGKEMSDGFMNQVYLPALDDIFAASRRIEGVAAKTPLVESPSLSKRFGRRVYLKLECFQPIRVFKIRGAYNKISQLSAKNIVAVSSGNHGMAVAYSCLLLGKKCTLVLTETAVLETD